MKQSPTTEKVYTAKMFHMNLQMTQQSSNDLHHLLIKLMLQLEGSYNGTRGYILHNKSGKILHQCRKNFSK